MKIACKNKLFVYCLIICSVISCVRADIDPIAEIRYFTAFQSADFAGEGTAVDHYGNTLVIDVKTTGLETSLRTRCLSRAHPWNGWMTRVQMPQTTLMARQSSSLQ